MLTRHRLPLAVGGLVALLAALGGFAAVRLASGTAGYPALDPTQLAAATLATVVTAGLLDGINPCAFTVLLLFVATLAAMAQSAGDITALRRRIAGYGSVYLAAIYFTYLSLGLGVLATTEVFTRNHLSARVGALLAILLGLWMLKDALLPGWGPRLQAPSSVGSLTARWTGRASLPAMAVAGFFVGLCTVPCSGAVYLAVISLLSLQGSFLAGFSYLTLYNLMFILPLAVVLVVASSKPALGRLAHWNHLHKEKVRLALGALVIGMGLFILAAV